MVLVQRPIHFVQGRPQVVARTNLLLLAENGLGRRSTGGIGTGGSGLQYLLAIEHQINRRMSPLIIRGYKKEKFVLFDRPARRRAELLAPSERGPAEGIIAHHRLVLEEPEAVPMELVG